MGKKLFTTAALVCCFMICLAAVVADLTGKWTGNVSTPDGQEIALTFNFKVDGEKLTGTAETMGHTTKIDDGKVNGNDFTFNVTNNDGSVISHAGKYYPGADSIGVDMNFSGMKFHCKLKRDK